MSRGRVPNGEASAASGAHALLLACAATGLILLLHPQLGVRDMDGVAYIIGARSIRAGNGYRSLSGEGLNHWPPGYSLLLSVFPDSLAAAKATNYVSFGMVVGILYYLLRRSRWTWQAAAGLSVALASGFFRISASAAHADILAYALFLLALSMASGSRQLRLFPTLIWAVVIPIKLIAVAFAPSALVADTLARASDRQELPRTYLLGAVASVAAVGSVLIFNHLTIGVWVPRSYEHSSLGAVLSGARRFIISIPREFLFSWHSSATAPFPRIALPICLLLAAACLSSLRPPAAGRWSRVYGTSCLACLALLLLVRHYHFSVRLVGYGMIALLLGFRPRPWANSIWLTYGLASLVVGVVNALTVNSLGSADPRYAELAAQVRQYHAASGDVTKAIATNSFHILDLHANIPSVPVHDHQEAARHDRFLWVTLPSFDPGAAPVVSIPRPGLGWCEERQFPGGLLFARCRHSTQ